MVLLEACKACGSQEFVVKDDNGFYFLTCSHCKAVVALLYDKKSSPSPTNKDFVGYSGMVMDFQCVGSGIMYSGFPSTNFLDGDFIIGT